MQRRLKQAFCSIKEHTSVSYAKIATIGGCCDLDLIVIKATSPDDFPLNEKYIQELLKIFSISPSSLPAFALCFTRRFEKTQYWRVALKSLLLFHRLLRSVPENIPFREEFLKCKFNGYSSLNPCNFQDFSSSNVDTAEDYTNFVRSYAHLLDESLNIEIQVEEYDDQETTFLDMMKKITRLLEFMPKLQGLIDHVMDCKPTGAAARNFMVQSAMKHIIRDSFDCYTSFRKEIVIVLDHLIQLPYRSCVEAFDIYKRAAIQANHLSEFYEWCKSMGFCGFYEYPFVDRVPDIQIRALGTFLNGMWQLTESSSSSSLSSSSSTTVTTKEQYYGDDDQHEQLAEEEIGLKVPLFDEIKNQEIILQPLIDLEEHHDDDNTTMNVNWETLLEASLPISPWIEDKDNNGFFNYGSYGKIQVYNPYGNPCYTNPFCNPNNISHEFYGSVGNPWGL